MFKAQLSILKAIWMALMMIFCAPKPTPDIIFLDTNSIAVYLLSLFNRYRSYQVVFIHHFPELYEYSTYFCKMAFTPDLVTAKAVTQANHIIVQTRCLAEVFAR